MVSDYAPGRDTEQVFKSVFEKEGGHVVETVRVPFCAPFLQGAHEQNPEPIFAFIRSDQAAIFLRLYFERAVGPSVEGTTAAFIP